MTAPAAKKPPMAVITAARRRTTQRMRGSPERDTLAQQIEQVAPEPPPCFLSAGRAVWLEVLKSIQASPAHAAATKPVCTATGQFNQNVNFCYGCTPAYRAKQAHLCRPSWFKDE